MKIKKNTLRFFANFGAQIFRKMKHIKLNEELTHLISRNMSKIRRALIVVCSVAYLSLNTDLVYAQNTQGGKQEQVLSQIEQKMVSFLANVQTKQEEVQAQIKQLESDLQNHQAKKKKKKDQAADELKEQTLKKNIAILLDRSKQYQKLEDDAHAFLATVKDKQEYAQAHPEQKPNTNRPAQSQQTNQGQTATLSEREKQIQAVQKNIAELTAQIEAKKQTSQSAQSTVSPEREKRLQELELKTLALNEQMIAYAQKQQQKSAGVSGQTTQMTAVEKEQKIQEVMQNIADITEQINKQKQANQVAYSPEREKRIQELERNAATLNEQLKVQTQAQQKPATVSEKPIAQLTAAERDQKIQEVMQSIADITEQINQRKLAAGMPTDQKQPTQLAASTDRNKSSQDVKKNLTVPTNQQTQTPAQQRPANVNEQRPSVNEQRPTTQPIASTEKDKQIKALEQTVADLNVQVKTYSQNQQRQVSTYEQKQKELTATISAKDRRIQELERSINQLSANRSYTSTKQELASSSRTQPTTSQRISTSTSTSRSQPLIYQGNINSGYYIIFGSFIERNNAERFLAKLKRKYPNVADLGNNNMFGMYRTGIGPYNTKEEALANRPTDAKNWVYRVETIPNTLVAYFEIIAE